MKTFLGGTGLMMMLLGFMLLDASTLVGAIVSLIGIGTLVVMEKCYE